MAYVAAVTADGGIPLLTRCSNGLPQLSFTAMGALFGISTYIENEGARILCARSESAAVAWKVYSESGILLVLGTDIGGFKDRYLEKFLDVLHSALVMKLGKDHLVDLEGELLRRALRAAYPLLDSLLNTIRSPDKVGVALQVVDRAMAAPDEVLADALDRFAYSATAKYGFLLVNGIVAVAAPAWWSLPPSERVLLCTVATLTPTVNTESVVYLEHASGMAQYRLLSVVITPGIHACILCGDVPSLHDIETKLVNQVWQSAADSLIALLRHFPANFPPSIDMPTGLLAVLTVHPTQRWAMYGHFASSQANDGQNADPVLDPGSQSAGCSVLYPSEITDHKLALVSWYHTMVSTLTDTGGGGQPTSASTGTPTKSSAPTPPLKNGDAATVHRRLKHDVSESYLCTARYKCYFLPYTLRRGSAAHVMALFQPNVPTFTLRSATVMAVDNLLASGSLIGI
eukprot:m.315607 g.315607  ORF g.315607 m.315607 type:complete len:458 (+) comp20277_c0_seq2:165-1538(+)